MDAIAKQTVGPGLELVQVPVPEVGVNDVLIKVKKTSICGTDVHLNKWDAWAEQTIKPPIVIGHEYVGEVVEVGRGVMNVKVGDRVSGEGHIVCMKCRNCLAGKWHQCSNTKGVGIERQGAFAEFVCIPKRNVWHADPNISDEVMACFDPFGNAVHTALAFDLLCEDVLITGAGPIGCMAAGIAKHAGARNIVVTDVNPYRLEIAKAMGATRIVDVRTESIGDVRKELGIDEGFGVGLEMSGVITAFHSMIDHMMHGGKIALLGIMPAGEGIDWVKVIFKSLTIQGIYGRKMFETWYKATALIQGGMNLSPVITHEMDYKDFKKGFELMESGMCGKVILNWS